MTQDRKDLLYGRISRVSREQMEIEKAVLATEQEAIDNIWLYRDGLTVFDAEGTLSRTMKIADLCKRHQELTQRIDEDDTELENLGELFSSVNVTKGENS